ncbi:MAG: leucine-rich repeat domain-containing protein [Verrucomicrobia bacterium]|nr:leucine-rich repeat domain-containing protein [Verrucomicrobiota bacterium]
MKADKISYSCAVLRFVVSFILLASLLVLPNSGCNRNEIGSTFEKGHLKYVVRTKDRASKTGTVSVRAVSKNISGDIEIPASVTFGGINYSVTEICVETLFTERGRLPNVTASDGVASIPEGAFMGCSGLKSIIIPDSVTSIGDMAFYCCSSLTNIIIPDSVSSIGKKAFNCCNSLMEIVVGENNPNYSSLDGVLFNKDRTTLIQCPGSKSGTYTIPDNVTSIGEAAFWGCSSLTDIIIPDSVVFIESGAFYGCRSLTSLIIPDNVTEIESGAFFFCSSLTNIIIPDSVTEIGKYAFRYCGSLTNVTIPDSVTSIKSAVFSECRSLTSIIIPDSVTEIGKYAFRYCGSLTSITIPDSVTEIGEDAFWGCDKLTDVYFKGNAPKLPEGKAFFDPSVIYYKPGTTGWRNSWSGRPTKEWIE